MIYLAAFTCPDAFAPSYLPVCTHPHKHLTPSTVRTIHTSVIVTALLFARTLAKQQTIFSPAYAYMSWIPSSTTVPLLKQLKP